MTRLMTRLPFFIARLSVMAAVAMAVPLSAQAGYHMMGHPAGGHFAPPPHVSGGYRGGYRSGSVVAPALGGNGSPASYPHAGLYRQGGGYSHTGGMSQPVNYPHANLYRQGGGYSHGGASQPFSYPHAGLYRQGGGYSHSGGMSQPVSYPHANLYRQGGDSYARDHNYVEGGLYDRGGRYFDGSRFVSVTPQPDGYNGY